MAQKKTLSEWLSQRFLLIINDEETFAEKAVIPFTWAKMIVIAFAIFMLTFLANFFLVNTLFATKDSAGVEKLKFVELSEEVEKLKSEINTRDQYILQIKQAISGEILEEKAVSENTENVQKDLKPDEEKLAQIGESEAKLRMEFEATQAGISNPLPNADLKNLLLFSPVRGSISKGFLPAEKHFGADILAKKGELIKCIADGTVVMASWTTDTGWTIAVQHHNKLISFYKHNSLLYKEVGDLVRAGDPLSVIGNTGEYTDGPHLHFELWYNGTPINPTDFIHF
ncbi:MAG: M23 family peptidase [Bacteroidetes bacterium]|nr:MAG: M23 family peptidase [Bacteroidota bacterium]